MRARASGCGSIRRFVEWAPTADFKGDPGQDALSVGAPHRLAVLRRRHQSRRRCDQLAAGREWSVCHGVLCEPGRARSRSRLDDGRCPGGAGATISRPALVSRLPRATSITAAGGGGVGLQTPFRMLTLPGNAFGNTHNGQRCDLSHGDCHVYRRRFQPSSKCRASSPRSLRGKPLSFIADYAKNNKGGTSRPVRRGPSGLDTAYAAGVAIRTRDHGQHLGSGATCIRRSRTMRCTDSGSIPTSVAARPGPRATCSRVGYGFGRNFRVNGSYFWNDTNIDIPTTIAGVGPVTERKYKRLAGRP